MEGSVLAIIGDISAILLLLSGAASCLVLTVVAIRVGPVLLALLENTRTTAENLAKASGDVVEAMPLLRFLGPAGRAANLAETRPGRLWEFLGPSLRRGRQENCGTGLGNLSGPWFTRLLGSLSLIC